MIVKSKEISEKLTGFYKGYIEAYKQAAANSNYAAGGTYSSTRKAIHCRE